MSLFKVTDVSLKMHLCRIKKRTSLVIRAIVFEQLFSINRLRAKIHSRNIPRMSIRWIGFSRNTSITTKPCLGDDQIYKVLPSLNRFLAVWKILRECNIHFQFVANTTFFGLRLCIFKVAYSNHWKCRTSNFVWG